MLALHIMRWLLTAALLAGCGRLGFSTGDGGAADGPAEAPGPCVAPYTSTPLGCYRFVPTLAPWLAAEQDCEDDASDAHLVVIDSVDEHFAIHDVSAAAASVWLAYTDRITEGQLVWLAPGGLDPAPNPCFFGPTTANSGAADCVTQDGTTSCGDWFHRSCSELHAYVCERDGSPADATRY
jgi:Lectin C-type domain